jgi:hypothetical protein
MSDITVPGVSFALTQPSYPWLPAVSDLELVVPQRVSDGSRHFTDDSVPTSTQVQGCINLVAEDVYAAVGDVPDNLLNAASYVTLLGAAWLVETAYTSNEAEEQNPALDHRKDMYDEALGRLKTAVQEGAGQGVPDAVYGFSDLSSTQETPFGSLTGGFSWSTNF